MANKTIELECPNCQARLTLDAGFAGGVCRCSSCGTLMTVPADPQHESAEQLVRPDAPGGPGGRPDEPTATAAQASGAGDTYTTASGRTVQVDRPGRVPVAHKRRAVKITTAIVFLGIVAVLVAACIVAILTLLHAPTGPDTSRPEVQPFRYDSSANPFLLNKPNALGMSLGETTVVVVQASSASGPWLELANKALVRGLTQPGSGAAVDVIYATSNGPLSMGSTYLGSLSASDIESVQRRVKPTGDAALGPALERAMGEGPTTLVLVVGEEPGADALNRLRNALHDAGHPVTLNVVAIDADSPDLEDLARQYHGDYALLSTRRLRGWTDAAPQP